MSTGGENALLSSTRVIYNGNTQSHQNHAGDQTRGYPFTQQDITEDNPDNRCGEVKNPHMAGHIALVEFRGDNKTDSGNGYIYS